MYMSRDVIFSVLSEKQTAGRIAASEVAATSKFYLKRFYGGKVSLLHIAIV